MKTIKIKLEDRTIEVGKLPLGKYAELLKALKELPKHIQGLQGKENQEIISALPNIIAESLPDFINLLTIATPLKSEEIEQMGLDEVVNVVMAVWEVNNYNDIFNNIKKVTSPQTK